MTWLACAGFAASEPSTGSDIFQAIRNGDEAALRALLKRGADLRAQDESGDTPLMAAAWKADVAAVRLLLKSGADVNATNAAGATALMRAATFPDKVRLLVDAGADVKARSVLGNTTLILAARKPGNNRTVEFLLERGAEVNATNVFGATALMAAAAAADADMVRLLLDHGANVNAAPNMDGDGFIWGGGRTPLMWASYQGDETLVKLLLGRGAKVDGFVVVGGALAQAAWAGHAGAAQLLLDAGAPVDQRDLIANYTPLHWAAASEHASTTLVDLLLARGADANAEGGQPVDNFLGATKTPLDLARKRGDTPIVRALLKAGARDTSPFAAANLAKAAEPPATGSETAAMARAIQRAIPPLTKTARESVQTFLRHASKQNCISCHQQQLPQAAISLAQSRHFATDREVTRHQISLLKQFISSNPIVPTDSRHTATEMSLQTTFHPEAAIMAGYTAMVLSLDHEPASATTDTVIHELATIQHADGHWSWNLPRPPIQASDIGATALAIHTIQTYGIPARQRELETRVRQARAWLKKARPETNEERIHQLLGLAWSGEKPGALRALARNLLREQRLDGGWSQLAGLESDAYATGQALYALVEGARISSTEPALRRGLDFLVRTQMADGTWHIRRRAHPFQPPMDSSFPYGADGWISGAGTSWAVMALASSLDPSQPPPAPSSLAGAAPSASAAAAGVADKVATPVEFVRDIQPLLERSCVACHSGERPKGGYQVTARTALLQGGNRGEAAVIPGQPEASPLLRLVRDQVEDLEMPPRGKRTKFPALTSDEIAKVSGWIAQGAHWPQDVTLHSPTP